MYIHVNVYNVYRYIYIYIHWLATLAGPRVGPACNAELTTDLFKCSETDHDLLAPHWLRHSEIVRDGLLTHRDRQTPFLRENIVAGLALREQVHSRHACVAVSTAEMAIDPIWVFGVLRRFFLTGTSVYPNLVVPPNSGEKLMNKVWEAGKVLNKG